jgi:uncharacterized protein YcgI (DUF1989 family)
MDFLRYGVHNKLSCRSNFAQELAKWSLGPSEIVSNINFFMRVTFGPQGEVEIAPSPSKAGDYVVLRAEMPVIAVLSNCPQQNNPSSGFRPSPVEVTVSRAPSDNPPQAN